MRSPLNHVFAFVLCSSAGGCGGASGVRPLHDLSLSEQDGGGTPDGSTPDGGLPDGGPDMAIAAARFSRIKADVLSTSCAFSDSCHSARGAKLGSGAGLDLATDPYKALVNGATQAPSDPQLRADYPTLVVPGQPARSALLVKISLPGPIDANYGYRMPQSNAALDAQAIADFKSWIAAGAPND